jgi:hypothetical protein
MEEDKYNNHVLTIGTPVSVNGNKLNSYQCQDNIMTGLADNTVQDNISPTATIDIISNSNGNRNDNGSGNGNSHVNRRDLNHITSLNRIDTTSTATSNEKHRNYEGSDILTEADNAAIAAQTIALAPGTLTGTANDVANNGGSSNINIMNSNNIDINSIQNAMMGHAAATAVTASNTAIGNSNYNANQNIPSNGMPEMILGTKNSNIAFNNNLVNMSNANNNIPTMNNMNLNQYILASTGVPPISLPANTAVSTPATAYTNLNVNVINPITPATIDANNSTNGNNMNITINSNQHYQSAILQQNAAIMRQNAATLQHLKNLHRANKILAANPETAATLGMLAPIMNMNLPTTTNPVQLLATAAPPLNLNNNNVGDASSNTAGSTFLPAPTLLQATTANLSEIGGPSTITTAPIVGAQQQQSYHNQQQQDVPIPAQQPGTIAIAPGGSQSFPVVVVTNNNMNNSSIANSNNGIVDGSNNNNNDAVQNILRTAFMLQNSGLSFLQQGVIPQQQQQQLIPTQVGSGIMLMPNNNNSNTHFGIVSAGTFPNNNINDTNNDNISGNNESDVGNNGGLPTSAVAAAANAAASVLPPASMNLPLQQQLQQQQLNTSLTPQMGMDLSNSSNNNNSTIPLLAGAVMDSNNVNNGSNNNNNSIQLAGLATLQQQQHIHTMAYPPMNLPQSLPQLPLPLISSPQQTQQLQQQSLGSTLNPTTTELKQQQSQTQKKQLSISRPLYLDHDSNCEFSILICFSLLS